MIRLLDKTKISLFTFFFVFCFIAIYAGRATQFAHELGDIRTVGNAFALFLTLIFVLFKKIQFKKDYFYVVGIFLLYGLTTVAVYGVLSVWWLSVHFFLLTYAYVISKALGCRLMVTFETIMFYLSLISLLFWLILLISPELLESIVRTFAFSKPHSEDGNVLANMIVYTLSNYDYGITEFNISFLLRNPGFAWEPGAFASMICLAIFCNILRTNFKLTNNKALIVFLITLLSTQSTTGLSVFVIIIVVWLFSSRKFGWAIVMIPLALWLFNLSFFGNKLLSEQSMLQYLDISNTTGQQGRFFSLSLDWQEFLRHPLLGLGCNWENTWLARNGYDISTISGIGDLLATFGGIVTVLFIWMLCKSSSAINRQYSTRNGIILLFVILGSMVSYSFFSFPIYIAFWMYGYWGAMQCPASLNVR